MEFRVLGPLEVLEGDHWRVPSSPRDRAALSELLAHVGEVVSADHLVEALWGDELPVDPINAVQVRVSRLRKFVHRESLVTCPTGYMLHDASTDATQFMKLIDEASRAAPEHAISHLDVALRMWRGIPFQNVPSSTCVGAQALALEEARLLAVEKHADLAISLGRHAEVISELASFLREHPLRERLRLLLMHALYLAGRQGEALDVYKEGHRASTDELGLAPGPELRDMQQAILEGSPTLLIGRHAGVRIHTAPRQLPTDIGDFVGRDEQVDDLKHLLSQPNQMAVVSIVGMAGIGKTSLAIHAAHGVREAFPDGQLFVDLRGSERVALPPAEVLARFITALDPTGPQPVSGNDLGARYRSLLADRRALIILDDVADRAQIDQLLPGYPGCAVVLTSRRWSAIPDSARAMELDGLDPGDADRLLTAIVGVERASREPEALRRVSAACAGVPLVLRAAGRRLASRPTWPVEALARRLAVREGRLDELAACSSTVSTALASSCRRLDRVAARCLRAMATIDGHLSGADELSPLVGAPLHHVEEALERLVDAHLAQSPVAGRYCLHTLVRLYAATLLESHDRPCIGQPDEQEECHQFSGWRRPTPRPRVGRSSRAIWTTTTRGTAGSRPVVG